MERFSSGLQWIRVMPAEQHIWIGGRDRIKLSFIERFSEEGEAFAKLLTDVIPEGSQYDFLRLPKTDTAISSEKSNLRRLCSHDVLSERTTALLEELDERLDVLDAADTQPSLSRVILH